jgi:hypothetical protein
MWIGKIELERLSNGTHTSHPPSKMSLNINITPQQIVKQRDARKKAGLVGCQDGSDMPFRSLRGISWRLDTKGRAPDHPDFDPDDPHCFCHDCRRTFDPDGTHDLKLINMGNTEAIRVYSDLIQQTLPKRSNGGGIAPPPPLFLQRNMTLGVSRPPPIDTSSPLSLPTPRVRDIMTETPKERLKADLATLRGEIQHKLILVMDSRRRAVALEGEEREAYLEELQMKENALWAKLAAAELLLKN